MGKPGGSHVPSPPPEFIGREEQTGGSEPSQYPQEEKATAIPEVAASETGTAQTGRVYKRASIARPVLWDRFGPPRTGVEELQTDSLVEALWKVPP